MVGVEIISLVQNIGPSHVAIPNYRHIATNPEFDFFL